MDGVAKAEVTARPDSTASMKRCPAPLLGKDENGGVQDVSRS